MTTNQDRSRLVNGCEHSGHVANVLTYLCIGDVHIKEDNYSMRTLFFSHLSTWITQNSFDHIVILGDVLDKHEKINTSHQNEAIDWFMSLIRLITGDVFVLVGNHDMINNKQICNEHGHWMYGIKNLHPRLHIVDVPIIKYNCVFSPYVPPGTFCDTLYKYLSVDTVRQAHGFFAHQEFVNANMESFISVTGDSLDWLRDEQWIVSGHIHTRQWVKNDEGIHKVYYTGSSLQQSMGDVGAKTVALCTFPSHPPNVNTVDLNVPRRIKVQLKPNELQEWLKTAKSNPSNIYMLWIVCSKEEYKLATKSKFKLSNVKLRHILPALQLSTDNDISAADSVDTVDLNKPRTFWEGLELLVDNGDERELMRTIQSQRMS
jgi:DNA repair exonuclease SbcCD nuclease subunit